MHMKYRGKTPNIYVMLHIYFRCLFTLIPLFPTHAEATLPFPVDSGTYVISEQQVLFYTLDALPILLCFLFYILLHPAYLLPREIILSDGQEDSQKAIDPPAAQGSSNVDNSISKPQPETLKGGRDLEDLENGGQGVQ